MTTSIVMATYNGEKYVEEQIESLLRQTRLPDEIIICDDCSSDSTISKIYSCFEKVDVPFRVIRHEYNQGVIESFSDGIKAAKGEIIFLCDQDDYWHSDKVEKFIAEFEKDEKCTLVFSNADITDDNLRKQEITLWDTIKFSEKMDIFHEMLKRNIFTGMCMAFKKVVLLDRMDLSKNMLHDEYIGWLSLFAGNIRVLNQTLVSYRQHVNNVVGVKRKKKYESIQAVKHHVKVTRVRSRDKYEELLTIVDNKNQYECLNRALSFYQYRVSIIEQKRIKALFMYINKLLSGDYQKYTSQTEQARLKDLFCIIL
ncbi:hypothetical protein C806_01823 [Lachnospiraceae bacterium 3-1]|nr:hypothetical protein C806_01823 [Lachnospiraceae bacterium 3-1]